MRVAIGGQLACVGPNDMTSGPRNASYVAASECYNFDARIMLRNASSALSFVGEWLSLVEHLVRDQGVGGSNPLSPTIILQQLAIFPSGRGTQRGTHSSLTHPG
jgi:hypothetical protein